MFGDYNVCTNFFTFEFLCNKDLMHNRKVIYSKIRFDDKYRFPKKYLLQMYSSETLLSCEWGGSI